MRSLIIISMIWYGMTSPVCFSQAKVQGNCDHPDGMVFDQTYSYDTRNDSLVQTLEISLIGNKQIRYSIQTRAKDDQMLTGELIGHYSGVADWDGCFGAGTSDDIVHIDNWDYRSKDGLLIISLYGADLGSSSLEIGLVSSVRMTRIE